MIATDTYALITGATSGIGLATARQLAALGQALILCGRRSERLAAIAAELSPLVTVHTLNFDITDRQATMQALGTVEALLPQVSILVNNAGNAHGLDPIHTGNIDDWDTMIDLNVKGLLYVTRAITPHMVAANRGHVVNIGSIAGRDIYGNGNVYCASKSAVHMLTEGMRIDLNPYGIRVTGIYPGAVETEFSVVRFKGDEDRAANVYKGFEPLKADDVADAIVYALTRKPHVAVADMMLLPTAQASPTLIKKTL